MTESEKERTKLLAVMLNTLASNVIVVGFVVPLVAVVYRLQSAPLVDNIVPALAIWPASGFVLHVIARLVLKDLDP